MKVTTYIPVVPSTVNLGISIDKSLLSQQRRKDERARPTPKAPPVTNATEVCMYNAPSVLNVAPLSGRYGLGTTVPVSYLQLPPLVTGRYGADVYLALTLPPLARLRHF